MDLVLRQNPRRPPFRMGLNTREPTTGPKKGKENLRRPEGLGSKGSLIQM